MCGCEDAVWEMVKWQCRIEVQGDGYNMASKLRVSRVSARVWFSNSN